MALEINHQEVLTPPVPAATVVLLRDKPEGMQVLLLKRHSKSNVLGGAFVFPGGKLDKLDNQVTQADLDQHPSALQQALAEDGLDEPTACGLHVAALRETFEECDLLLHGPGWDIQDADLARAKVRERLASGRSFLQAMADADLRPLPTLQLQPWSRWITPRRPSMMDRRFDTRFFVAIAPADQQARHDEHEITEALWLRPNEAMQRYWEGELTLAPVQLLTLMQVGRYRRAVQVMQAARSRAPMQVLPEPHDIDGQRVLCYPGDPGHSVREPAWEGPTRMTFRNGRFEPEGGLQALLS